MQSRQAAIINSSLWAAYADALGFIGELTDEAGLKRRIGSSAISKAVDWKRYVGGKYGAQADLPAGCYSDDTQLRTSVSRAIRGDGYFDVEAFAKVELPVWCSYALGAGVGTKSAARNLANLEINWYSNFFASERSKYISAGGNGAAMRVQPHVWAAKDLSVTDEFMRDVIRNSVCTHGHARGIAGAVFHAFCLGFSISEREVPSPQVWGWATEYLSRVPELIKNDSELQVFWLPVWEERAGVALDSEIEQVQKECFEDIQIAADVLKRNKKDSYVDLVKKIGALESACRGSGTKTAILASALSWLYREESPEDAVMASANLLHSDTDTIGTMAGALIGAVTTHPPKGPIQDHDYLVKEATRLAKIAEAEEMDSFCYPDLMSWRPPRTQLDAVGLVDEQTALAGLGFVKLIGPEYQSRSGTDAVWQWMELDYGQTVLAKRRPNTRKLAMGNRPVMERQEPSLTKKPMTKTRAGSKIQTGKNKLSGLPTDGIRPNRSELNIDELSTEAIKSDFLPSIIGAHILELSSRPNGIELAIAYVAIIAKARVARQRMGKARSIR